MQSSRHHQHLVDETGAQREDTGNGTGHNQIYCHNETQPPIYFSNYHY